MTFPCSLIAFLLFPQTQQPVRLDTPDARLGEEFSSIRGVRELADGRLLVSDYFDQRVVLVDLARGSVTLKVGEGGGPREARLHSRLVPFLGDSTLLVDLGNNRLLVLDGAGNPVRTISAERPGMTGIRGAAPDGALYFAVPGWADPRALPGDSVRVVRWRPGGAEPAVVTVVQGDRMRSDIGEPAPRPRIPTVGYAALDGWTVGEGGALRIVRTGGYRIEILRPGAAALTGPAHAYATRPVTAADRLAFVRRFLTNSPMSGRGEGGGLGFSPRPSEALVAEQAQSTEFAERHPMFLAGEVHPAPEGRLWVGRPVLEGSVPRYDVFDAAGRRVLEVELRPGRRVAAVGRRGVYVVAEAEDGTQRLERYAAPR